MNIKASIIKPGVWGLTRTDLRTAGREAMREPLMLWHRRMKGLHFQKFAVAKYGYKPNDPAYEKRKKKEHPEANGRPMVWTGDSENRAMASDGIKVAAGSFERFTGWAIINAPTLNYQRLADQVTRVTEAEIKTLESEFAKSYTRNYLATAAAKQETLKLVG